MPTSDILSDVLAARQAAAVMSAILAKDDADCGCGCKGAQDCEPHRVNLAQRIVIPGLVNSSTESIDAKAAAHAGKVGDRLVASPLEARLRLAAKVGSFGSHDRVVQAAQAVVSLAVPGDMSDIRSPIRSTIYETLTPGGGRDRRLRSIGRNEARRCPPGFQNGGRFANSSFSNCGSRLFALAGGADDELNGSPTAEPARRTVGGKPIGRSTVRRVGAGRYGDSPIQSRNADIPPTGRPDRSRADSAIEAESVAAGAATNFLRVVRKDGIVVKPLVSVDKLSKERNNPELVGSTVILSANRPNNIGGPEIKLFGAGVAEIRYVVPGGSSLILRAGKPVTPRRASALHRQLEALRRSGDEHGRALKMLADKAPELTLAAQFKNLEDANELIVMERNGMRRTVQKWAFLTWYAHNAPGRPKSGSAWRVIEDATPSP